MRERKQTKSGKKRQETKQRSKLASDANRIARGKLLKKRENAGEGLNKSQCEKNKQHNVKGKQTERTKDAKERKNEDKPKGKEEVMLVCEAEFRKTL